VALALASLPAGFALYAFEALDGPMLYAIMALRQRVFVVEQQCIFQDADGRDTHALHLVHVPPGATDPDAYLRLFLPRSDADQPRHVVIGRVLTAPEVRGTGLGHRLVAVALDLVAKLAPGVDVHIAAQAHLDVWYAQHGFVVTSAPYLEDDIPHVDMVLRADRAPDLS